MSSRRLGEVVVTGASGKTGRAVAEAARALGLDVRALSRSPHVADQDPGLVWHVADLVSGRGLSEALAGTQAVYAVMPNVHPQEATAIGALARRAHAAGVERFVYHSVAQPHDARMPHHVRKAQAEQAVREVYPDAVVLCPCAYLQNLTGAARSGELVVPYDLDAPFTDVDLRDVARVAAAALAGLVTGTITLAGPQRMSVREKAAVAEAVLGRPVHARAISVDRWLEGPGCGLAPTVRNDLAAMFGTYDQTGLVDDPGPLARVLEHPPGGWSDVLRHEAMRAARNTAGSWDAT